MSRAIIREDERCGRWADVSVFDEGWSASAFESGNVVVYMGGDIHASIQGTPHVVMGKLDALRELAGGVPSSGDVRAAIVECLCALDGQEVAQ